MKPVASRLTFPLLCLAVGLVVFGVSYTLLGQGPEGNVGDRPPGSTPDPTPGGPGAGEGEPGPVASVNELLIREIVLGDVAGVERLLENGADPNQSDEWDDAALHTAAGAAGMPFAKDNSYGVVRILLTHGANPNQKNRSGITPMHRAASYGSDAVMTALLEAGGNPLVEGDPRGTPYEIALLEGNIGAITAIERFTNYRPANYSDLKAEGALWRAYRQAIAVAKTDDERRQAVKTLANGFLTLGLRTAEEVAFFLEEVEP